MCTCTTFFYIKLYLKKNDYGNCHRIALHTSNMTCATNEHKLHTFPEHICSSPIGIRVAQLGPISNVNINYWTINLKLFNNIIASTTKMANLPYPWLCHFRFLEEGHFCQQQEH